MRRRARVTPAALAGRTAPVPRLERRTRFASAVALALALAACKDAQPCPKPLIECSGQCVDVQSDPRYCGGCGTACRAAEVCVAGTCGIDTHGACTVRLGGAFVTLGYPNDGPGPCAGQVVKVWIQGAAFVDEAVAYVGSATPGRVPVLDVVAGADCDAAWSWSVDAVTAAFGPTVVSAPCAVCPADIQANVPAYVADVGRWCPGGARILAVERRPAP